MVAVVCLTAACALNRPQVKSLRDPDAARIEFDTPVATRVSALNSIPSRCGPAGNRRVRPEEFHVYQVDARISRVKRERDHDIHIVLADLDHPRDHLVAEIDDPVFRHNARSPYRDRLAAGRRMFEALVAESGVRAPKDLRGEVVRVTGVGFFDINHLQLGRSRSCIELHPVLAIQRLPPIPQP